MIKTKTRRFSPTLDALEGRNLMSFGGGNVDLSIPRFPSTSPQLNFTSNSFHQLNGRVPGTATQVLAGDVDAALATFTLHVPNGQILNAILHADVATFNGAAGVPTTAAATTSLDVIYETLLDREPTSVELNQGVAALQHGATVKGVVTTIVTSTEFIQGNISPTGTPLENENQFVTALYDDVLGRDPDAGGLDFWVNELDGNAMSVEQVATAFVDSPEAATSDTSVLQTAALPVTSPTYYFGVPAPDGTITGNFAGTSQQAQMSNLLQRDLLAYFANNIGTSFNLLKSHVGWASDNLLTYNGRVD